VLAVLVDEMCCVHYDLLIREVRAAAINLSLIGHPNLYVCCLRSVVSLDSVCVLVV
jgi:hypothetical protein